MKARKTQAVRETVEVHRAGKPTALVDTRVVYCGDCLEQLRNPPDACVDLHPPFNSNRD